MTSPVGQVPQGPVVDSRGNPTEGFLAAFSTWAAILQGLSLSGTTAQRPTKLLWIGRPYFDTSLGAHGKPIWYSSAGWIDATSTLV